MMADNASLRGFALAIYPYRYEISPGTVRVEQRFNPPELGEAEKGHIKFFKGDQFLTLAVPVLTPLRKDPDKLGIGGFDVFDNPEAPVLECKRVEKLLRRYHYMLRAELGEDAIPLATMVVAAPPKPSGTKESTPAG